ncbi:hypothetical protein [Paenibacillus vortex]|uniref:hypothetical protein n=1 Tax=Paenibacillus vortex TaxID=71995 RepID=UPI00135F1148|nr:hypothetical protein [Paenibacillus vortex]
MFNEKAQIHKEIEAECILDLCATGISGIEPMPYTNVGGKEIIKLFIIRDVQSIQLPRM